jgi:hypothetical protein
MKSRFTGFLRIVLLLGVVSMLVRTALPPARSGIPTAHGMIITEAEPWHWHVKPGDFWVPDEDQVARAERAAWLYFEGPHAKAHLSRPLSQYKRQYLGLRKGPLHGRDERRTIQCFFTSSDVGAFDLSRPVDAMDGGDSFFEINYDVSSGQCSNFQPNAQA